MNTQPILRTYSSDQVKRAAELLALQIHADSKERERLTGFYFRHDNRAWWTCDPENGRWYRFVQDQWLPASPPAGRLLGSAWVADMVQSAFDDDIQLDDPDIDSDIDNGNDGASGPQAVAVAVADILDEFSAGEVDSYSAEMMLCKFYYLDAQWQAWAVGVQSGIWYRLTEQGWQQNTQGPQGYPPQDAPDYNQRVIQAQAPILSQAVASLPEPLVDSWNPPMEFFKEADISSNESRECHQTVSAPFNDTKISSSTLVSPGELESPSPPAKAIAREPVPEPEVLNLSTMATKPQWRVLFPVVPLLMILILYPVSRSFFIEDLKPRLIGTFSCAIGVAILAGLYIRIRNIPMPTNRIYSLAIFAVAALIANIVSDFVIFMMDYIPAFSIYLSDSLLPGIFESVVIAVLTCTIALVGKRR